MAIAGSLTYDTKLDTKGFESGLNKISSTGVAIGNLMADVIKKVAQTISEVGKMGVEYNAQIETYQTALTTLTGSAEKANKIIEQVKKDAAATPFEVASLVKGNQLLISAGLSAEQARDDILALGNAISATGGGEEELSRMVVNLQQIKNVGKASALDIKQFAYAGIDVYGLLADYTGKTREEVAELDISYEDLTGALKFASQEGGKYFNAMEKQSKTFNGQLSNLKDNFMAFLGEAAMPLFTYLKDEVLPIINGILDGTLEIDDGIDKLTETFLNGVMAMINSLLKNLPKFLEIGMQITLKLISGIVEYIPELIPTAIDCIFALVDTLLDNLDEFVIVALDIILALAFGLIDALPRLIEKLPEIITKIVLALTEPAMIAKLIEAALQLIIALAGGLIAAIPSLLAVIPKLIMSFFNGMKDRIKNTDWKKLGKDILKGIINGFLDVGNIIWNAVKRVGNSMMSSIKKFFGIKSPSRLMRDEVGKYLPKGIAVGIEANTDSALDSIDDMNDKIFDKMSNAVNFETGKMAFSGTSGSVSQILSANSQFTGNINNVMTLDGEVVYENQQTIKARKQLQYGGAR